MPLKLRRSKERERETVEDHSCEERQSVSVTLFAGERSGERVVLFSPRGASEATVLQRSSEERAVIATAGRTHASQGTRNRLICSL